MSNAISLLNQGKFAAANQLWGPFAARPYSGHDLAWTVVGWTFSGKALAPDPAVIMTMLEGC